jgi:hypothetical protein
MTPTNALTPSDPQVGKLHERLLAAARKSGVTPAQFQLALGFPGTDLEDEIAASIVKFSKRASGIVTPVRAQDTGLIPEGWTLETEELEGDVELGKVDYSYCPVHEGEQYVNGPTMLQRSVEQKAVGSLGYAAELLKAQKAGKEIFPVESRGKHYFVMPRTVLLGRGRVRHVAYFVWGVKASEWVLDFDCVDFSFSSSDRLLRPRE